MNTERVEKIIDKYNNEYRKLKKVKPFTRMTPTFSISSYEYDLLDDMATRFGVNKSEFIRVCIHYFATSVNYKGFNNPE